MIRRILGAFLLLGLAALPPALAQPCFDRDGDGALAGFQCPTASDCNDRDPAIHPGAPELCNGLDDNCDGTIDEGCVRTCAQPSLFRVPLKFRVGESNCSIHGALGLTSHGAVAQFNYCFNHEGYTGDYLLYTQGFDPARVPWQPAVLIGDPTPAHPQELRDVAAVGGERMIVAYQDRSSGNQETYRVLARVVDRLGKPVSAQPLDLTNSIPNGGYPWHYEAVAWDGERFVVFWSSGFQGRNKLLMSKVTYDGRLDENPTVVVTDNVDGQKSTLQQMTAAWTGTAFIVVVGFDLNEGMAAVKVDRDGKFLGSQVLPVSSADAADIVNVGDRLAMAWVERDWTRGELRFAFLDFDGKIITPPGIKVIFKPIDVYYGGVRVAWSGEVVGVLLCRPYEPPNPHYPMQWRFWQVRKNGSLLAPAGTILRDGPIDDVFSLIWNGSEFQMTGVIGDWTTNWERIICGCTDKDGDGFDTCMRADPDDNNPAVHPGAPELCRGGVDEDGDGAIDCQDSDCPIASGPGDVTQLRWSEGKWVWEPVAGAEVYDLARGLISDLMRRQDLALSDCVGKGLTTAQWSDDSRRPPVGDALWYLIRVEGTPCARSGWGDGAELRKIPACR